MLGSNELSEDKDDKKREIKKVAYSNYDLAINTC